MGETTTLASIIGGVVTVISGWFGYRLALRKDNRIDNDSLNKRLDRELDKRDLKIAGLEQSVLNLFEELRQRDAHIAQLEAQVAVLSSEVASKDGIIATLKSDLDDARTRIRQLEAELEARLQAARAAAAHHDPQGVGL